MCLKGAFDVHITNLYNKVLILKIIMKHQKEKFIKLTTEKENITEQMISTVISEVMDDFTKKEQISLPPFSKNDVF